MQGFGNWLRQLGAKISSGLRHFMQGRYGSDKLNTALLIVGLCACFLSMLTGGGVVSFLFTIISYTLMILVIFRSLSRNTYKRYRENCRYLRLLERIKDRDHKYFDCPRCHQPTRVPRHKGKISITCPKCGEKFIRKS